MIFSGLVQTFASNQVIDMKILTCFALALIGVVECRQPTPQWPDCYFVSGVLQLPYAEIAEPFSAWYEGKKNRSRVDYYDIVKTLQIGGNGVSNFGSTYKIAPMTTEEVLNDLRCFLVNGTASGPVSPQQLLPDMSDFQLLGMETRDGVDCYVWQNTTKVGGKKNVYTLWQVVDTKMPVRYEMIGYDSLLGSHYDRYYIDYTRILIQDSFPDSTFLPPNNMTCGDFPGPGMTDHHITMNPISEYLHPHDNSHVQQLFHAFKKTHRKRYADNREHETRKHNFRHNLRFIHSKNRAGLGYRLAVNHFADMNDAELRMMRGRKYSNGYNGGLAFDKTQYAAKKIPEFIDWRLYGAVTQVKDQAVCGSCWSFGTTGVVEGAHFRKTGELVRLSQQELVDCSWGQGNNGCDGGEDFRAYQWIIKHGLASEADYGSYLAVDAYCHQMNVTPTAHMTGYVNVTSGDVEALKVAIATNGPVSVGIDAAHRSLSFYANGVYYEPQCGNKPDNLDHAVLAVGYGVLNGEPFWLVKNSWSTYWGNDGYVLMSQKDNNCGVATAATFVLM